MLTTYLVCCFGFSSSEIWIYEHVPFFITGSAEWRNRLTEAMTSAAALTDLQTTRRRHDKTLRMDTRYVRLVSHRSKHKNKCYVCNTSSSLFDQRGLQQPSSLLSESSRPARYLSQSRRPERLHFEIQIHPETTPNSRLPSLRLRILFTSPFHGKRR